MKEVWIVLIERMDQEGNAMFLTLEIQISLQDLIDRIYAVYPNTMDMTTTILSIMNASGKKRVYNGSIA